MATTKKTQTKQTARKGAKKTGTRTAGKTARAKDAETFTVPRTAKQLAAGILERCKRSPEYWAQVRAIMVEHEPSMPAWKAAQVMPRKHAPETAGVH